ncbi:MAG: alpha-L-fucosidase [Planctomycetota bacterium]
MFRPHPIEASRKVPGNEPGAQRHSRERLARWSELGYGMFIHFGMSTFVGHEMTLGTESIDLYNPTDLDVDQWVQVARDAGMKYMVLTTKHVSGHCLWPTDQTDAHVGNSPVKTDVVGEFVNACNKHGIVPAFYYCSWDNRNRFGSLVPTISLEDQAGNWNMAYTTPRYRDFQLAQVEELLTRYGNIGQVWIDIPGMLGNDGRRQQYDQIAALQPDTIITMNNGISNGTQLSYNSAWPTDIITIERYLPSSDRGHNPWFEVPDGAGGTKPYYLPAEVCDPIGYDWFFVDEDRPRSTEELLGMRLITEARGANLLLDVPPDRTGKIPQIHVDALLALERAYRQAKG